MFSLCVGQRRFRMKTTHVTRSMMTRSYHERCLEWLKLLKSVVGLLACWWEIRMSKVRSGETFLSSLPPSLGTKPFNIVLHLQFLRLLVRHYRLCLHSRLTRGRNRWMHGRSPWCLGHKRSQPLMRSTIGQLIFIDG